MHDLTRENLVLELRALRPELEREGIVHAGLFGSRARKDNRLDSDIDLIIEVPENRKFSLLDLAGIYGILEDRFGLESSIILRDKYLSEDFLRSVDADLIQVF